MMIRQNSPFAENQSAACEHGTSGSTDFDIVAADKPEKLPVVLSRKEISLLLPEFEGLRRLMFLVL